MIIFSLLPLLVFGALIALIVRAVTGRGESTEPAGMAVRRFFQYGVMYGVVVVVAVGFTGLVTEMLPDAGTEIFRDDAALARSLSFVIVGGPVLAGLAAWTRRQLDADPAEKRSFGWAFYLTVTSFTALLTAGWGVFETLRWIFQATEYSPEAVAQGLVWAMIWGGHWWITDKRGHTPRMSVERLAGSAVGMIALAGATGFSVATVLGAVYDGIFSTSVVDNLADDLASAVVGLIVGGAIWWWYWLRHAIHLSRDVWWHSYVLLIGVLGGLVTLILAGATTLYTTLVWLVGDPGTGTARSHFEDVPALVATAFVGFAIWWYHRAVLRDAAPAGRTEVDRVYDYLLAGTGLVAAVAGITAVLVAIMETLVPGAIEVGASARNTLVASVTMLVIGGPIWWLVWSRIQRHGADKPVPELRSTTRRIYLFALFGVGGVVALISLIAATFVVIEDLMGEGLRAATLDDVKYAVALVFTTGMVAWYHWQVYRADRLLVPAEAPVAVRDVVLVSGDGDNLAEAIRTQLGARVRRWHRLDAVVGELDPQAAIETIRAQPYERLLVVTGADGLEVVPFEEWSASPNAERRPAERDQV